MHCISSSLCFWFWSILRETADSLYHKMAEGNSSAEKHFHHGFPSYMNKSENPFYSLPLTGFEQGFNKHPFHFIHFVDSVLIILLYIDSQSSVLDFLNASQAITTFYDPCVEFSSISELVVKMSPYLYPFSIEYSILIGTSAFFNI